MTNDAFQPLAWDGWSCEVPEDWNLAMVHMGHRSAAMRLDDAEGVRLEIDWLRRPQPMAAAAVRAAVERQTRRVKRLSATTQRLDNMPKGWEGVDYALPDGYRVATAWHLAESGRFLVLLRVHARPQDTTAAHPRRLADFAKRFRVTQLARRFENNSRTRSGWHPTLPELAENGALPGREGRLPRRPSSFSQLPSVHWAVYDVAFSLPSAFELQNTTFEAGRKCFEFAWKQRRLWIWQFSLADLALRGRPPADFGADFLKREPRFRTVHFRANGESLLAATRRRRPPYVTVAEIGRRCFRYAASCVELPEKNALFLSCFQHRGEDDVRVCGAQLDPKLFRWNESLHDR